MQDPSKPIWVKKEPVKNISELDLSVEQFSIFVATPVHSEVSIHYCQALLEFQQYCFARRVPVQFQLLKSSLVTQGRNLCVSAFMESKMSYLLFIDSDIDFQSESIFKMINANKDIIAIPYPLKSIDWDSIFEKFNRGLIKDAKELAVGGYTFPMRVEDENSIEQKDGIMEVTNAPAGCMLIKRNVIEKMIKAYPDLEIVQPSIINGKSVNKPYFYNFFDTMFDKKNKKYFGEDFAFCKLWTDIGGKCYAYINDYITHVGEHQYCGKFLDEYNSFKK